MPNLLRYLQRFYDHGRRYVGLTANEIDALLASGATASYDAGTIMIEVPHERPAYYPVNKHLHRDAITGWVTTFNKRSQRPEP